MEHHIAYNTLSEDARCAWETISGLPLASSEQQRHAWDILCAEVGVLAHDPQPSVHMLMQTSQPACDLFVSGAELAALRVIVAWLKANDRAGRMRDLPVYPDLAEMIIAQLGEMPWPGVCEPAYLDQLAHGGTLWFASPMQAQSMMRLLEAALARPEGICPGWSVDARARLVATLCDVWYWLHTMLVAHEN